MESWGCFGLKKDSQKQMPKIDFSKKGENTYFKTHNRLFFGYFFNRRPIWEALIYICGEVAAKRSNILESPFTMLTWRMEDILGTVNKLYDQIAGQ